jgi:hypothetical protein
MVAGFRVSAAFLLLNRKLGGKKKGVIPYFIFFILLFITLVGANTAMGDI